MSVVCVEGLSHNFGDKVVLCDINLSVEKGQILAVMGSSGGGKTTLLRCISGLIEPTTGTITVNGTDVAKNPEKARRHMGMVFQTSALFDYMNVEQNVLFGVQRFKTCSRKKQKALVREMLDLVGLEDIEKLMPDELSGGMRKRVGIARALALQPSVMLYDEPTTGLDPISTYSIDQLIVRLTETLGVTCIIVSHDVSSVFRVADQIAFLDTCELVFYGDKKGFSDSKHAAIQDLLRKSDARELSEDS